jgi:hypothetical protein
MQPWMHRSHAYNRCQIRLLPLLLHQVIFISRVSTAA